ncbi:conserved phage C-terminal domain-containing protein [Lactococcus lactis]|nr:conserved phage C-terminal domain-containing protein [Lactococcus lactis]
MKKQGEVLEPLKLHKRFIKARWNENYKLDDFKRVVDNKVADWTGKTINGQPAEKYLQPSTLFGTKFDNYLNQAPMHQEQAQPYDDLGLPF